MFCFFIFGCDQLFSFHVFRFVIFLLPFTTIGATLVSTRHCKTPMSLRAPEIWRQGRSPNHESAPSLLKLRVSFVEFPGLLPRTRGLLTLECRMCHTQWCLVRGCVGAPVTTPDHHVFFDVEESQCKDISHLRKSQFTGNEVYVWITSSSTKHIENKIIQYQMILDDSSGSLSQALHRGSYHDVMLGEVGGGKTLKLKKHFFKI